MSDQAIVERADLMKKDKGELQTIVEALGGKAASRARKSDLIDQILELSGVVAPAGADTASEAGTTEADAAEADTAETGSDAGDAESAGGSAPAASTGGANDGAQGEGRSSRSRRRGGRNSEPPAEWEMELQNGGGASDQADSGKHGGRNGSGTGGTEKGGTDQGSADRSSTDKGSTDKGSAQQSGADKGGADKAPTDKSGADDDGQNRRRRRRGRNRDRDDDGPPTLEPVPIEGFLELRDDGYGFVRVNGWIQSRDDVYVSVKMVRQLGLRRGDHIVGTAKPATRNEKNPAIDQIDSINGLDPAEAKDRPLFDDLTPVFPSERLALGADDAPVSAKVVDAVAPLGKGQRGLILTPPSSGKTTLLADLAAALEAGHPEAEVVVLLIDERPEEVTDLARRLGDAEVVASAFDRPPEEHVALTELTVERAKRLAERGHDVIILLDGLTRLTRAHNLVGSGANRILPGGLDAAALHPGKRVMGAARKLDEGGSITIIATLMVETGSEMDDAIAAEFTDTANAELVLDRQLAADGVFPALDLERCATRNAQLLGDPAPVVADSVRSLIESFGGRPGIPR